MPADLQFTGERFLPGIEGEIAYEHWHRYAFARRFVVGKRVADVACGEGYGSALLAGVARDVVGIDISADAIAHARAQYARLSKLGFEEGSATALPLAGASVDAIVSFETIEHLPRDDQSRMIAEFARVLGPEGALVLSTPNPSEYSLARDYRNPFHHHEPARSELATLLEAAFPAQRWFRQRRYFGSAIWAEDPDQGFEAWAGDGDALDHAQPPAAMYFIVIAARSTAALPVANVGMSLFSDRSDTELARLDAQAREAIRLDGLLGELRGTIETLDACVKGRDAQLIEIRAERDALLTQLRHALLECSRLSSELGSATAERDAAFAASNVAHADLATQTAWRQKLEQRILFLDRTIAYRQSARWWLRLPWFRAKLLWPGKRDG